MTLSADFDDEPVRASSSGKLNDEAHSKPSADLVHRGTELLLHLAQMLASRVWFLAAVYISTWFMTHSFLAFVILWLQVLSCVVSRPLLKAEFITCAYVCYLVLTIPAATGELVSSAFIIITIVFVSVVLCTLQWQAALATGPDDQRIDLLWINASIELETLQDILPNIHLVVLGYFLWIRIGFPPAR
jgi:hypothetical protein